jgi:hypothetical protein
MKDDSAFLKKVKGNLQRDERQNFIENARVNLQYDRIQAKRSASQVKTLPKRAPKPAVKKTTDSTPIKKVRKASPWVEHVKKYARENNVSYREAMKLAKSTYAKQEKTKAPKKPKKEKKPKLEHQCEFCNYSSSDKSNYNRHMKKHTNREKILKDLMSARGFIRTHKVRAVKSKNKDVREKSQAILDKALKAERIAVSILKRLESGDLKTTTAKKTVVREKAVKKGLPKYAEQFIERINKAYLDNNDTELGLKKDMITEFTKNKDRIIIHVKNLEVDDGEKIDSIMLVQDDKFDGYNVSLMQDIEVRGETQSVEYEEFYIY